jgi:GTPase
MMINNMKTIEIIGQTNRGKSSLFNGLLCRNISITDEEENTTRDYIRFWGKDYILTDNMGLSTNLLLDKRILNAHIILYVIEYSAYIDNIDEQYFRQLRKNNTPFYLIVNKCDNKQDHLLFGTAAEKIFFISTKNNYGLQELRFFLKIQTHEENKEKKTTIALVGGVNSGKSSILNLLSGYKRSKVSSVAATTRDIVMEQINQYSFFDTAGFNQIDKKIEKIAMKRTIELIKNIDICIIVVDVSISFSQWNKWLWYICEKYGKGIIFIFNKSDILRKESLNKTHLLEQWRIKPHLPYIFFSTFNNHQIPILFKLIKEVETSIYKEIPKSQLTFLIKNLKLPSNNNCISIAHKHNNPQTFHVYTKRPLKNNYQQYLENQLIVFFKLKGIKPMCFFKKLEYSKYK